MASAVLFLFSASIMMFQISCSKTASAGTNGLSGTASKIVYFERDNTPNSTKLYIKNSDGTGLSSVINVSLPSSYTSLDNNSVSTDGTNIYLIAYKTGSSCIFRCDMNGASPKIITETLGLNYGFDIY